MRFPSRDIDVRLILGDGRDKRKGVPIAAMRIRGYGLPRLDVLTGFVSPIRRKVVLFRPIGDSLTQAPFVRS